MRAKILRRWWIILVAILLLIIGASCDPLNRLEFQAARNPTYFSSMAGLVKLPPTASVQDVLVQSHQFGKDIWIIETRSQFGGRKIVWVQSELGQKVAIVNPDRGFGWSVQTREP